MQRVYHVEDDARAPQALEEVAQVLRAGGLVLMPTETVYGIGVAVSAFMPAEGQRDDVPPYEPTGYRRIFELKQRELTQTVPWLVSGVEDLDRYGRDVDVRTRALARSLWPGALTLVVPAAPAVPTFFRAADGTVALRASASPVVAALVRACGCPLAVTSANTHGKPAPTSFAEVEQRILDGVDAAIDAGETPCRDASTIVSFPSGTLKIIRQGALSASAITHVLDDAAPASGAWSR